MQRYGLAEACDAIEPVLRRVALARGRTQKVKVLTGTGEYLLRGEPGAAFGDPGVAPDSADTSFCTPPPGNVNVTTLDYSAAAYEFLRDFRAGCLGRVTLD